MIKAAVSIIALIVFSGCSTRGIDRHPPKHGIKSSTATTQQKKYRHPTMRPYTVHGRRYYPTVVRRGETFEGRASWYGPKFHGKKTSSGEQYDMHAATAAHKTLPMNTIVKITGIKNGKSTIVRINDRGPFVSSRIIDLSKKAASDIDMIRSGTMNVRLEVLGFASDAATSIPTSDVLLGSPESKIVNAFYVQIGSFRRFEGAMKTQEQFDGFENYHAVIKDSKYNDERLFRVWLGTFQSEDEARDFVKTSPFEQAFIVRE